MTDEILTIVRNLLDFPQPSICRHAVALQLVAVLRLYGSNISEETIQAIIESDDETALKGLEC